MTDEPNRRTDIGAFLLSALGARRITDLEDELEAKQARYPFPRVVYMVNKVQVTERVRPANPAEDLNPIERAFTVILDRQSPRYGDNNSIEVTWIDPPPEASEAFRPGQVFALTPTHLSMQLFSESDHLLAAIEKDTMLREDIRERARAHLRKIRYEPAE